MEAVSEGSAGKQRLHLEPRADPGVDLKSDFGGRGRGWRVDGRGWNFGGGIAAVNSRCSARDCSRHGGSDTNVEKF